MRKSLLNLRKYLANQGFPVVDIRYIFNGKVYCIGFFVHNFGTKAYVEVEPKGRNEWFVCFNNPYKPAMHYAKKREGFMPGLCREYKYMKKEILEHLQDEKS